MINQKELKRVLNYNPETGVFTWRIKKSNIKIGYITGSITSNGYLSTRINCKSYLSHRLAWLYVYGQFPENDIDHINHIRSDNRIKNLRVVINKENCKNKLLQSNNTSGVAGVTWYKRDKKWLTQINYNGKTITLGLFKNINDAKKAREKAKIKYGYHKNHA